MSCKVLIGVEDVSDSQALSDRRYRAVLESLAATRTGPWFRIQPRLEPKPVWHWSDCVPRPFLYTRLHRYNADIAGSLGKAFPLCTQCQSRYRVQKPPHWEYVLRRRPACWLPN